MSEIKKLCYRINEIFYSIQGEGLRTGTANIFVRFSGCNRKCTKEPSPLSLGGFDCDTEYVSGVSMTAEEIIEKAVELMPLHSRAVIFTGGEPLLQLSEELVLAFQEQGFFTAIETNGSLLPSIGKAELDWISCSPKVAEHAVAFKDKMISELRYVRGVGQGIPKPVTRAAHYYLSPAFIGNEPDYDAIAWCSYLIKKNPTWKLSVQSHKAWRIR